MKPYLMFHLPNDKSEEGIMYSDYEYTEEGFVTCWAPLEKYDFFSISLGCENISSIQRLINTNYDFIPIKFMDDINKILIQKEKFDLELWNKVYV